VSDRRVIVSIPAAQTPLARVLVLMRLVAVAVLLFGAGFWFLSEQAKPGQLDTFRLGHFLLLALTYSLFFVIFAVLEFHGKLGTAGAMIVSAVFSWPLLVLHVSRVLDFRFTVTRVLPLSAFTLGLVINGVYGGPIRDYVFIGAAIFILGYVTVGYEKWSARRGQHRQEKEAAFRIRRRALLQKLTTDLGDKMSELSAIDAQATEQLKARHEPELFGARARLDKAREPVNALCKEHEELMKRLPALLPAKSFIGENELFDRIEREADAFRDRLEPHVAQLRAELAGFQESARALAPPARDGEVHCVACGRAAADAPFCQHCGAPRAAAVTCPTCRKPMLVPVHLMAETARGSALFCASCGARMPAPLGVAATGGATSDSGNTERA